jgi:hypothetical protein
VVHLCNPSTGETEAGGWVWSPPGLHNETLSQWTPNQTNKKSLCQLLKNLNALSRFRYLPEGAGTCRQDPPSRQAFKLGVVCNWFWTLALCTYKHLAFLSWSWDQGRWQSKKCPSSPVLHLWCHTELSLTFWCGACHLALWFCTCLLATPPPNLFGLWELLCWWCTDEHPRPWGGCTPASGAGFLPCFHCL